MLDRLYVHQEYVEDVIGATYVLHNLCQAFRRL